MALDLRVPMAPIVDAFGLAVTITRPSPNNTPVAAQGVWTTPLFEEMPAGNDFRKLEPRKVLAVPISATLASIPRGSIILAPEYDGAAVRTWRVDGLENAEADCHRLIVVAHTDTP